MEGYTSFTTRFKKDEYTIKDMISRSFTPIEYQRRIPEFVKMNKNMIDVIVKNENKDFDNSVNKLLYEKKVGNMYIWGTEILEDNDLNDYEFKVYTKQ
jgi:hypothetical protein